MSEFRWDRKVIWFSLAADEQQQRRWTADAKIVQENGSMGPTDWIRVIAEGEVLMVNTQHCSQIALEAPDAGKS